MDPPDQPGHQQQQQQQQRTPQQYPRQGAASVSTGTPSNSSSPSSYTLSELGGEEYAIAAATEAAASMATTMHPAARSGSISSNSSVSGIGYYQSPSPQPSYYTTPPTHHRSLYTPPSSYLNPHSTAAQYAQLPRPRPASRTRSSGYSHSSRSHSRSLSPPPHSSPTVRQASLNAMASGASPPVGFPSSSLAGISGTPYAYQQLQRRRSQQQQPQNYAQHQQPQGQPVSALVAPAGGFMARPPVPFPSQFLPSHPALAALRTPSRPGWAERLSQRTVDSIIAPYRRGDADPLSVASAAWGDLGVLPQAVLDRVWSYLRYKDLIFLREVSRTARDTIDPQRAHQDEKYIFVREREDRLDELDRHQAMQKGRLGSAQQCRAPNQAACYFCYKVKPTTEFQGPTTQRHWVTVHADPMTGKVQYIPIPDPDDEASPMPMAPPSRRPSYATQMEGNYGQFGGQNQQPQQQYASRGRSATPVEGTKIHLRQYCIECGVDYGLHVPGELYKTWASEGSSRGPGQGKSKWICECEDLPPRDRIHDLFLVEICNRCNRRASYR